MIEHYLLTLSGPAGHLHGYLMCSDKKYVAGGYDKMVDAAEQLGFSFLPIVLSTHLTSGVELVRGILRSRFAETASKLDTAKDFHFTIWTMPDDDPDDIRLMALH